MSITYNVVGPVTRSVGQGDLTVQQLMTSTGTSLSDLLGTSQALVTNGDSDTITVTGTYVDTVTFTVEDSAITAIVLS